MLEISLFPEEFYIFGVNVGLSVVIAWGVIAFLLVALVLLNLRIRRFTERPKGLQTVIEFIVEGMHNFAAGKVGHYADMIAPVTLTLMAYVFFGTFLEIFGLPPATEDINCTLALGIFSFIAVNVTGIRVKGVKGRIKTLSSPIALAMPIRMLTDCIAPFSMGVRLFSNVLVGGVIMQLIYKVVPIILPAAVGAYFNVLHVMIQTFVFGLLSLIYTSEAVE